ncbi:Cof-type HAD-IIB family hydrolase [Kitasatospora sp. LaBMicrA B282]|uniref:Cof-type HAD-IIB family hydrolase n=1 Tax=Kitasatospora sp. LaBMicrA B282 TaxID=3420949 RepID=UPI003D13281E
MTQPATRTRLIATDLDGTLLCHSGTVSERTAAALALAEQAGIQVVFVTGRPPRWMQRLGEHIGGHGVAICSNGGAVYDVHRDRLVESFPLAADDARAVVARLRERLPECAFAFEYPAGFAREPEYEVKMWGDDEAHAVAPAERLLTKGTDAPEGTEAPDGAALGSYKILVKHPDLDPDVFLAEARAAVGPLAEITRSSPIALLEISARGVTKASTLARWCAEQGIDRSEVVAFGDMPNDLEMLAWAGTSYAVANAHPEVLAAVAQHTLSNQDDGVARVIEDLVTRAAA